MFGPSRFGCARANQHTHARLVYVGPLSKHRRAAHPDRFFLPDDPKLGGKESPREVRNAGRVAREQKREEVKGR